MSCGYDEISYTIRLSDLVLDTAGYLDDRETAQRIARLTDYPVSMIDEAADKANYYTPGSRRFVEGRVLCLPPRWVAEVQAEIEAEDAAIEAANQQAAQEQSEAEGQDELVDNTVVPAYMLRTEEDFLRYVWIEEFDGSLSNFDADHVRGLITGQFVRVLMDMYDHAANWGLSLDGLPIDVQSFLSSERSAAEQSLNSRSIADLLAFFDLASSTLVPIFEDIAVIPEDVLRYDFYQQTYSDIQLLEAGETPSDAVFADYQADLAAETFWVDYTEQQNNRVYLLADFVLSAAREGYFLTGFSSETVLDRDNIASLLLQQLGEDWNPNDFADLANRLVDDYWNQKELLLEQELGNARANEYTGRSEELALDLGVESSADVADYNAALALDDLRAVAYDPNWNPAHDAQLLQELYAAVEEMPASILGIDIGWVRDGMRAYYDSLKQIHDWRMGLKADVDQIELGMLNRQQQVDDPLWWLGLVAETIFGFFDIGDTILSLRDASQGDLLALAFLAADLFLPVIGDAIMSIRRAGNAMDAASDTVQTFLKRTDDVGIDYLSRHDRPTNRYEGNPVRPGDRTGRAVGRRFSDYDQYGNYTGYRTQQLEDFRGRGIIVDENFVDEIHIAGFRYRDDDGNLLTNPIIQIPTNASRYEWFHEATHAKQWLDLGAEGYVELGVWRRELHVYEQIIANKDMFNIYELNHAWEVLNIYAEEYLVDPLSHMPANPYPFN